MPLRLAVLAHPLDAYAPRRLREEIAALGHRPIAVDARILTVDGVGRLCAAGTPLLADAVVHILSTDLPNALGALASGGDSLPRLNAPAACLRSADKYESYEAFVAAGVPTPITFRCTDDAQLLEAAATLGWPMVVKQPDGAGGREVALARSAEDLRRQLPSLRRRGNVLLAQEYVATSFGTDLRVDVLDGRVVAAGRRVSAPGDFRSNVAQGGHCEVAIPSAREAEVAIAATAAVGLDFAGVDVLTGADGPLVVETNSFPGLDDIEPLTGVNIAGEVVVSLIRRCASAGPTDTLAPALTGAG